MNNNDLFSNIHSYIEQHELISPGNTIIIGLSGGPDSIFLLHVLASLQLSLDLKLVAAHLDHGWRADSSKDVLFCQEAAASLGVPFMSQKLSDLGTSWKFNGSLEEIGRKARRHFLGSVLKNYNAQSIALGHHAQDQQENFFIRLLRGTSLSGLAGMRPMNGFFIRPLLGISKETIVQYLRDRNIDYLEDPTNQSDNFLRNRIRQYLIPALKICDTRFEHSFNNTLNRLQSLDDHLEQETIKLLSEFSICKYGKYGLNLKKIMTLPAVMQKRFILAWLCKEKVEFPIQDSFLEEIIRFFHSPHGGMHQIHHTWSIGKKQGIVWINKMVN